MANRGISIVSIVVVIVVIVIGIISISARADTPKVGMVPRDEVRVQVVGNNVMAHPVFDVVTGGVVATRDGQVSRKMDLAKGVDAAVAVLGVNTVAETV